MLEESIWLALIESEQAKFSFWMAIPQTLAYLMGRPQRDSQNNRPLFGMASNGDSFLFVKLSKQPQPIYALSSDFSLFEQSENQLYSVLRILKNLRVKTL